jgi:DNA mismatch repair protein MutL
MPTQDDSNPFEPQQAGAIQLLPPDVAAKIAAGEVVERPANAAKELIENAIDAGAREIRVEIREGGRRLLRVSDNGSGMRAEEAPLAFLRHATSKLRTAEDLERIGTFGFRGEALYSIAAVSHLTLLTRHRSEEFGAQLRLEGGSLASQGRAGAPVGTVVSVEHLFFNVPARAKFLRAPATEAGHINAIVQRYALALPERRFSFVNDGRLLFQSNGSGDRYDVLLKMLGPEDAAQMIPIGVGDGARDDPEAAAGLSLRDEVDFIGPTPKLRELESVERPGGVVVTGYASLPTLTRANRSAIQVFVNRRAIEDRTLAHAVVQAYHTLLPVGRSPLAVVFIEIDPALVDVNVHPQKSYVRFAEERRVFSAVQKAVRQAVIGRVGVPDVRLDETGGLRPRAPGSAPAPGAWDSSQWAARRAAMLDAGQQRALDLYVPPPGPASAAQEKTNNAAGPARAPEPPAPAPEQPQAAPAPQLPQLPPLRVVGQVGAMYVIAEGPEGVFLIDQHAAHERILYEKFMAQRYGLVQRGVPRQPLLEALPLHVGSEAAGMVAAHLDDLARVGFEIEPFGGDSFLVRAVPSVLAGEDPLHALTDIVTSLGGGRNLVGEEFEARLVKMVCKRAAIKAGQLLSDIEMQELVRQLEQCQSPRTCPHGRPTMIQLSAGELEKAFGRV